VLLVWRRGAYARANRIARVAAGIDAKHVMTRKPQPLPRWDIYSAAAKAKWIGTVEAVHVDAAAQEFNVQDIKKLHPSGAATVPFARFERGSLAKSNTWHFSKFSTSH